MPSKSSKKADRTRYYTWIVYPDSAPEGWKNLVDEYHLPWACSPLHENDVNPDGTPKKPHWHCMLCFDSLKTREQAEEITSCTRGTIAQPLHGTPRTMIRYFAHLDNPDKAQYRFEDIEKHGGLDISEYKHTSTASDMDLLKAMIAYIVDADVTEYEDLVLYAMHNEPDWFEALALRSTYFINAFIKSRRHRREAEAQKGDKLD